MACKCEKNLENYQTNIFKNYVKFISNLKTIVNVCLCVCVCVVACARALLMKLYVLKQLSSTREQKHNPHCLLSNWHFQSFRHRLPCTQPDVSCMCATRVFDRYRHRLYDDTVWYHIFHGTAVFMILYWYRQWTPCKTCKCMEDEIWSTSRLLQRR